MVKNLGKHKARTRHEMRLTAQIGKYEMDQVILNLGSDTNVFPKKNLGKNGATCAPVVSDLVKNGESIENYPNWEVARGKS